jgi:outer membrane protein assembly factor BamB
MIRIAKVALLGQAFGMPLVAKLAAQIVAAARIVPEKGWRFATVLWLATLAAQASGETRVLTNEWSYLLPAVSDSSPALAADGTIYFATWNGDLLSFQPDGKPKWVFHAGREIASSPAVGADGTIYFGSRDRKLHAIGPNGKRKWEFSTGAWVDSSAAVGGDGAIYFGSWDGKFYSLNSNGIKTWEFQTGAPIVSSPAIGASETVYFGSHDKNFYALSRQGAKEWVFATGGPITSSPAIDRDGTLFFSSVDGYFYALGPKGTLKWRLRTGGISESSPVIGQDGTLFIGVNTALWAVSPDGRKKWEQAFGVELIVTAPLALADESVCYVSRQGLLINMSIPGMFNWVCDQHYCGTICPTVSGNGILYSTRQVSGGTYLYAIPANAALARSAWPKFRGNLKNAGNNNSSQTGSAFGLMR